MAYSSVYVSGMVCVMIVAYIFLIRALRSINASVTSSSTAVTTASASRNARRRENEVMLTRALTTTVGAFLLLYLAPNFTLAIATALRLYVLPREF